MRSDLASFGIIITIIMIVIPIAWLSIGPNLDTLTISRNNSTQKFDTSPLNVMIYNVVWIVPAFLLMGMISSILWYAFRFQGSEVDYVPLVSEPETEEPHEIVETPKAMVFIYQCPKCSANLDFEDGLRKTKCPYCGAHVYRKMEEEDED